NEFGLRHGTHLPTLKKGKTLLFLGHGCLALKPIPGQCFACLPTQSSQPWADHLASMALPLAILTLGARSFLSVSQPGSSFSPTRGPCALAGTRSTGSDFRQSRTIFFSRSTTSVF